MFSWLGWGFGGMFLGPLFMVLWLAIGVAAVVFATRWWFRTFGLGPPRRTPREILDERYARGEIDREEYQRRRDDIAGLPRRDAGKTWHE